MTEKMQFDKSMADEYDKGIRRTLPTYDAMLKLSHAYLQKHLPEDGSLLVVGGGGGNELAAWAPLHPQWSFTIVDPAAPMLAMAHMKAESSALKNQVHYKKGTVQAVTPEDSFDGASCLLVLHFIEKLEDKAETLRKIRSHLPSGAPFVMTCMFGDTEDPAFDEIVDLWKSYWIANTHLSELEVDDMEKTIRQLSFLKQDDIEDLLRQAGFDHIALFFKTNLFGGWICRVSED